LIDRIQDRYGHTIYKHDQRVCENCNADNWASQAEPTLVDKSKQVLDPLTAYQITSMMEGVIQRGTGQVIKAVGKHLAGKTGTTNEAKDLWFVGFSPNLAVGVYMGYDQPRSLGEKAQAASYTAPIFRDFMQMALKDKPDVPFRVPVGIKLISVDLKTGTRSNGPGSILEAFKPGTEPPDYYASTDTSMQPHILSPDADKSIGSGTGGLY
jgi:penicillin-binding protein 1A